MVMTYYSKEETFRELIQICIEKTLLDIGVGVYREVLSRLENDHHSNYSDCYKHPEYLNRILKDIFGNSYIAIINEIQSKLEEFNSNEILDKFLIQLKKY